MPTLRLSEKPPSQALGVLVAALAVAAATAVVYPLKQIAAPDSLGIVYIPGVLLVSIVWGLRLGLATAVVSGLAYNFFHLPPLGRLDVRADHDLVGLFVFVLVAIASGTLANLARARAAGRRPTGRWPNWRRSRRSASGCGPRRSRRKRCAAPTS